MVSPALQLVSLILAVIGLVGTCAVTGLPQWKVTAFIGDKLVVFENRWEGLWMNCVRQANIRMQCKMYDSFLMLSPELQASRALMCVAVALAFLSILIAAVGMKCTRGLIENEQVKHRILIGAGVMLILTGIIVLIPISWVGHTIIRNFYDPLVPDSLKHELGEALYIGWATAGFLIVAGAILCCSCLNEEARSYSYRPAQYGKYNPKQTARKIPSMYSKSEFV
ncbi:claudin-8-like [Carcharodon carcharias]|uniref:claudin-8-like n=1 Tax=Carcharodon carcharias TaxID=13397 RepID=UPI001B7F07B9|nr:claudin-8-like [Carcharodon carcharias]